MGSKFTANRSPLLLLLILILAATASTPALADWTASGSFNYVDRSFDQTGFFGPDVGFGIGMHTLNQQKDLFGYDPNRRQE